MARNNTTPPFPPSPTDLWRPQRRSHGSPLAAATQLFLGSLRDIEQEMVRERLSSAVMESLLALTIFREEFSAFFVTMFASLVFVKVLHWLVQVRAGGRRALGWRGWRPLHYTTHTP